MDSRTSPLNGPDTVGELRALYRSAEARAARLRLLIEAGRDLGAADAETLEATLAAAARNAALFAGHADGMVVIGDDAQGLALVAPGRNERKVGALMLASPAGDRGPLDDDDADALAMLRQLMATAIDRVQREAERDRLLGLLQERERRLEAVVARLFSAQEEERGRVSRDLHDGVAQTAGALFRQLEAEKSGTSPQTTARLVIMAQGLVRELRAAIGNLRPTLLDDLGLAAAVASLADALSQEGFQVDLATTGPTRWPPVLETAFYRVAQEAITNIRKHAGGECRVRIEIDGEPEQGRWSLVVRDWGAGMVPGSSSMLGERIGLAVMRERMTVLGGRLDVSEPADGGGVEVSAALVQRL